MPQNLQVQDVSNSDRHGSATIVLPRDKECDIVLQMPNGQIIELQYRLEAPSIDVCLPRETSVTNWKGDDMEPADEYGGQPHMRLAKQIVIDLPPEYVDEQ